MAVGVLPYPLDNLYPITERLTMNLSKMKLLLFITTNLKSAPTQERKMSL